MDDPTAIPIQFDPEVQRMRGTAVHGNMPFDVPFISHIEGNLWMGGCTDGLILPDHILHLISLHPWERYEVNHELRSSYEFYAYDASIADGPFALAAAKAAEAIEDASTLIHCEAGLNRSGLVSAMVLVGQGRTPREAIDLLRERRSPAVLCNPDFEQWLLTSSSLVFERGN